MTELLLNTKHANYNQHIQSIGLLFQIRHAIFSSYCDFLKIPNNNDIIRELNRNIPPDKTFNNTSNEVDFHKLIMFVQHY